MFEHILEEWRKEIVLKGNREMTIEDLALIEKKIKELEEENLQVSTELSMLR